MAEPDAVGYLAMIAVEIGLAMTDRFGT